VGVHLSSLNLNLLVSLDALLEERSVTRSARRVGVSQPAMSKSLRQLRELFADPLLVRGKDGLILTPRAARLQQPLRLTLDQLCRVLDDADSFDASESTRVFRVAMPDYLFGLIGGALSAAFIEQAPRASLLLVPFDRERYQLGLERGELDLAIHACLEPPTGLSSQPLIHDRFACALRRGHPALERESLSLELYAALPHLLISISDDISPGSADLALAEHGLTRHVACRVRSFLAAPIMLTSSDALLTGPERLLGMFAESHPIELRSPPMDIHGFCYAAVWHERFEADPGARWLRTAVEACCAPHEPHEGARDWKALWGARDSEKRRRIVKESGSAGV
jgi:DNA-binding transcriptional LysR family regulator